MTRKAICSSAILLVACLYAALFLPDRAIGARIFTTELRCGSWQNPLGIDDRAPRLSWRLESTTAGQRGQSQTAFQVLAAASRDALARGQADLWDSGKILSDASAVAYGGAPISGQQVFWKVRVWDQNNRPGDWSAVQTWTMGLLAPGDWQGHWICSLTTSNLPIFRRQFMVKTNLQRAVIYICGLGQYELFANGNKAGDALLSPGWSKYDRTCLYDTYDVTSSLTKGTNVLGVMLGNGMYNVTGGSRYTKFTGSFGIPKLIAQLHLFYADGRCQVIATDTNWVSTVGPITFSSIYGGEDRDARLLPDGISLASMIRGG